MVLYEDEKGVLSSAGGISFHPLEEKFNSLLLLNQINLDRFIHLTSLSSIFYVSQFLSAIPVLSIMPYITQCLNISPSAHIILLNTFYFQYLFRPIQNPSYPPH